MDYDISHYTDAELLDICGLDDSTAADEIDAVTDVLCRRYKETDPDLSEFFSNIRNKHSGRNRPTLQNVVSGPQKRFQTVSEEVSEADARSSFQSGLQKTGRLTDQRYQDTLKNAESLDKPGAIERQDLTNITTTTSVHTSLVLSIQHSRPQQHDC